MIFTNYNRTLKCKLVLSRYFYYQNIIREQVVSGMQLNTEYFSSILTQLEIDKNRPYKYTQPNKKVNSYRSKHSQSLNTSATKKTRNQFLEQKDRKDKEKALLRQKKKLYSQSLRTRHPLRKEYAKQNFSAFSSSNVTPFASTKNSKSKKKHINQFQMDNSQFSNERMSQMQQANQNVKNTINDNFYRKHKRTNALQQHLYSNEPRDLQISQIQSQNTIECTQKHIQCGIQQWALQKTPGNMKKKSNQAKLEEVWQQDYLFSTHDQTFQTTSLQKQLEQSQKYTKQLQQKIEDLLFWKNQFPNVLLKRLINQQQTTENSQSKQGNDCKANNFILERLLTLQQQVYSLRKLKNSLQLKVHASERKLVEQASIIKKKCAREINLWKKRYDDLARQNSILKGNLDETFTMEISRQQRDQ